MTTKCKYPEGYSLTCGCYLSSDLCIKKYFQFLLIQDFEILKTSNKKFSVFEYCFLWLSISIL